MSTTPFRELSATTRAYIGVVVVAGAAAVLQSFYDLSVHRIGWTWTILALLTLVSGSATVRLPSLPAAVSVSETFVFTSVLLFGASAGTLTVALDALIISLWSYRKDRYSYKIIFNVCAVPLTLWLTSHLYFGISPYGPLYLSPNPVRLHFLIGPLLVFTVTYYAVNTWLIALAISLERHLDPLKIWRENFLWISLNYFGGASVAALLVSYTRDLDYTYLVVIVPLLIVLYLTFAMSKERVEDANRHLSQLNALYMSTIETLAMAIDAKDQITHGHIRRVQTYAVTLARAMGVTDDAQIRAIEAAALLHDMGKLAVPEYILNKPGPLTQAEFEKMKLHASVGADILSAIDFPYPVVPIVRHHHESWDGSGYPDGLRGTSIPLGARILSVVDCFDALTSDRPYRPRLSDKDAIRILHERRGTMYDPLVVDSFVRLHASIVPEAPPQRDTPLNAITAASAAANRAPEARTARFEEIAASSDEMLTLFDLARALTANMAVQDATDLIAKHLRRLIPSSACVFYIYDIDTDELVALQASGEHSALIKGLRIPLGQRLSGWVAANRQTVRNSDPVLDLGESARAMSPRPRSCLSTPLLAGTSLVGVLSIYSSNKEAYSEDHERLIEVIARQVSPAIYDASKAERARARSLKDEPTGLPNLRHLAEVADAQLSQQSSNPFSLIVIQCGDLPHSIGSADEVDHIVAAIRRALRTSDLLFRSSSNEFAVLLLNTDRTAARTMASRVYASLVGYVNTLGRDLIVRVGVAYAPEDAHSTESLIQRARDQRVVISDPSVRPSGPVH